MPACTTMVVLGCTQHVGTNEVELFDSFYFISFWQSSPSIIWDRSALIKRREAAIHIDHIKPLATPIFTRLAENVVQVHGFVTVPHLDVSTTDWVHGNVGVVGYSFQDEDITE
uniref:Uncharacterized protein n=1 Tax=Arundo donax TaxID=35708 RepID=A0A0A9B925_ARUDO